MMTFLILVVGASGLVLVLLGMPPLRNRDLRDLTLPFVAGLREGSGIRTVASSPSPRADPLRFLRTLVPEDPDLKDRLSAAGSSSTVDSFRVEQIAWGTASLLAAMSLVYVAAASGARIDLRAVPLLAIFAFAVGFLGRDRALTRQIERRGQWLVDELPTGIDLLTLSIMSGESVPAALARVGATLPSGAGDEFRRVVADIRAGASAVEALEDMARRSPDPAMTRLVDALCTAIERGAPLAEVLRAQADDARESQRRRLLESGGRREVLMLVPVVFLILPVVVAFALLPGLVALDLLVP